MAGSVTNQTGAGWIDTHVHIFRRDAAFAADRRYTPDYDATPEQLLAEMNAHGVTRAILVQPSFLGTDNSYLLAAIAARPEAFSGIAVVPSDITRSGLAELKARGVLGVRLNCIGRSAPAFDGAERLLVHAVADLGLVLQIQAEGGQWQAMEPFLTAAPMRIVIDHFGRATPGETSAGFEALLRAAQANPNLWFKFSGGYRLPKLAAAACAATLLSEVGPDRIVWGSDWPHTQFEEHSTYAETLRALQHWAPNHELRDRILTTNACRLFR